MLPKEINSESITKASGSNLALSFVSLPDQKKRDMTTFYAFCRIADDIVDEKEKSDSEKRAEIRLWREEIRACYRGNPTTELGNELEEIIHRYLIPPTPFEEILNGVEMDTRLSRYPSFADLERYCYRVASAVGLVSIEIFEYSNQNTRKYAVALGMAFQLTNILRDVIHDLREYDRIYLPQDEIIAHGLTEEDLIEPTPDVYPKLHKLYSLQYHRAHHYYRKAARLMPQEDRQNLIAAECMTEVYFKLLKKLQQNDFAIGEKALKLSKVEKALAMRQALQTAKKPLPKLTPPSRIAVIGAGFAGIASAIRLSRQGHQVTLFESKPFIGGRAHSFKDAKSGLTLDNGQHILMGCYHSTLELLRSLSVLDKLQCPATINVPYLSEKKGLSHLKAPPLPSPFHLLFALMNFSELSWPDRLSIISFGINLRLKKAPTDRTTVSQWLTRTRQTDNAIRTLWRPLCIAALNEPIENASALLFYNVLTQSLAGSPQDSSIYLSKVGLSELLMPETEKLLNASFSELKTGTPIKKLHFAANAITSLETSSGEKHTFDTYISALPWNALSKTLPEDHFFTKELQQIHPSPIISIQIITTTQLFESNSPFIGLLDSPFEWIFDRTPHHPELPEGQYLYAIIISAAYQQLEMKSSDLLNLLKSELIKLFAHLDLDDIQIIHHIVYKSRNATFAARPETEPFRPGNKTPWKNLFLAGDWINTGLPATIESASLSADLLIETLDA